MILIVMHDNIKMATSLDILNCNGRRQGLVKVNYIEKLCNDSDLVLL